jgi:hypothetical protein
MINSPFGTGDGPSFGASAGKPSQASGLGDALDAFRQAWSSFALPPGMTPTIDPTEIERRIAELKTVEQWLVLNLGMLRNSIQALEIQLTTLAAMRAFGMSAGATPADAQTSRPADPQTGAATDAASIASGWWDLLQKQFNEVAATALSSMPKADPQAESTVRTSGTARPGSGKGGRAKAAGSPSRTRPGTGAARKKGANRGPGGAKS